MNAIAMRKIMCTVNYLTRQVVTKLIIIFLMIQLAAINAVNLEEITNLNKNSRIDLSLTLGSPSKKLKLNHSPIFRSANLDPNFHHLDFGGEASDSGSDLGLTLRDHTHDTLDLELGLGAPVVSQNVQPEKLSVTSAIHSGREHQYSGLPSPYSVTNPGRFRFALPAEYGDLYFLRPQVLNDDAVTESVLGGVADIGCSKQSNFYLTSGAQNPEIRNDFERELKSPNLKKAANFLIRQNTSPADQRTFREISGVKYFANDEEIRRELSHARPNAQEITTYSKIIQENNFITQKKKIELEKYQKRAKGKHMLEEHTNHLSFKKRKGVMIGAPDADLSTLNSEDHTTYVVPTLETLEYPYQNVLKIDEERATLIKAFLTKLSQRRNNPDLPRGKALKKAVVSLREKFQENNKHFEFLKNKWIEEWENIYKRIGFINENNSLNVFVDNEIAKNEAIKILNNLWESIPLAHNLTKKGRLKKSEDIEIKIKDKYGSDIQKYTLRYILNSKLESSETLALSSNALKYTLRILLPQVYHSIFTIDDKEKKGYNSGLVRSLNDISLQL
ncbi:expressed protein [Phakopsora pachyrhizi]|uniref:Expressed protein n=1 Tax=Phakopsora pachyrhizi TaxID=170000 RepID=A0AAV0BK84_PHAPC|nr:expressed protein [Phakopsora pachyrhizi]